MLVLSVLFVPSFPVTGGSEHSNAVSPTDPEGTLTTTRGWRAASVVAVTAAPLCAHHCGVLS